MLLDAFSRPGHFSTRLAPYLVMLLIVFAGHYSVFFGHSFFVEEDPISLYAFTAENSRSEAWIAGEALGASRFHGDPGAQHIWSPWSFWHKLFADQVLAFNTSILLLLTGAVLAQYILIRRIASSLSPIGAAFLASLIIYSPLRHEFFFQRHWITLTISAPLALLILCEFRLKPSPRHFFVLSIVFFLTLVLGSAAPFMHLGALCGLLAFVLGFSRPDTRDLPSVRMRVLMVLKILALVAASGLCAVLLDAWEVYPIFLERVLVGYVRDPNYASGGAFASIPALKDLLPWGTSYFHSGWLSPWMATPGVAGLIPTVSWKNVSPFFPVILLILLHDRQRPLLERTCLVVVVAFFIYDGMLMFLPGLSNAIQSVLGLYPLEKFEPAYQTYQVCLVACLVARLKNPSASLVIPKYARAVAAVLGLAYLSALAVFMSVEIAPGHIEIIFEKLAQYLEGKPGIDGLSLAIVKVLVHQHLAIWHERSVYSEILFLFLAAIGFTFLAAFSWTLVRRHPASSAGLICFVVLTNAFLALAVYPLNDEPLVWDANLHAIESTIPDLKSSRMMRVGVPCLAGMDAWQDVSQVGHFDDRRADWKRCVLRRLETTDPRYMVGYRAPLGLDLSLVKSFTQRDVAVWITAIFKEEGVNITQMRSLSTFPPLYQSRMYDLAGVKYLVSEREIPPQPGLVLRYGSKHLFVYENLGAWPQLFLAERISFSDQVSEMIRAEKQHVFLPSGEMPRLSHMANYTAPPNPQGQIHLRSSRDGFLQLDVDADRESLVVFLDAWHPSWVAHLNEEVTPVLRVNGIFKGVIVPSGKSRLTLQFETVSYKPGIFISLIVLIAFLLAWIRNHQRRQFTD